MRQSAQRGLSLIELMVTLVISTFLILAVTQVVVENKLGYLFHRAQADNQANARFTLQWLDRQLARTGFKRRPSQPLLAAFPPLSEAQTGVAGCSFAAGQVIHALNTHTLCIRYQPSDRQQLDCLGNGRPVNASSLAQPYSEPVEAFVEKLTLSTRQQLLCTSKEGTATMVEGIAELRFDFAIGLPDLSHYTSIPEADDRIRSVRYTALLSTPAPATTTSSTSLAWRYWHANQTSSVPAGQLFQVIKSTTALRNVLP